MKSTELRIGNWVYDPINRVNFKIECFLGREYCTNVCEYDDEEFEAITSELLPIPLTEEILLKCGFENGKYYKNLRIKANDYLHSIKFFRGKWIYSTDESDAACYSLVELKYLHQLQNLYFALTGEELNIEL